MLTAVFSLMSLRKEMSKSDVVSRLFSDILEQSLYL